MKAIIEREIKNYLKNPIYWLGIIVMIVSTFGCLEPYMNIKKFQSDEEIQALDNVNIMDADVMDGYVRVSEERQLEIGLSQIEKIFLENYEMSKEEARAATDDVKAQELSINDAITYLENEYMFYDGRAVFRESAYEKMDVSGINAYIDEKLKEHTYTFYFSRKYADFTSLHFAIYSCIILSFLYLREMRKDTYELLHTKPVSANAYVCGKFWGGFIALHIALFIVMIYFGILGQMSAYRAGFFGNPLDIVKASVTYITPTIFMQSGVYTLVSIIFKNPLPAVPMMLAYIIYSNLGSYDVWGNYGYHGKLLGILFRFDGPFFETQNCSIYGLNQILLIIFAGVFTLLAIKVWENKKV